MPDPKLQAYLASKYLSGPKADAILARTADYLDKGERKKLKKKKIQDGSPSDGNGLVLKDDSDSWKVEATQDADEQGAPQIVSTSTTGIKFKKAKLSHIQHGDSNTATDQQPSSSSNSQEPSDIHTKEEEDSTNVTQSEPTAMRAGLYTREQLKADRLAREERERKQAEQRTNQASQSNQQKAQDDLQQQTVYRDPSGRRINLQVEEEEHKRIEKEKEKKRKEKEEWGKGLVQRREREEKKKLYEKMKDDRLESRANDKDLNDHFKSKQLWNDPAQAFLTKKRDKGPQKPKYQGPPPPPNRFGVAPGYRWDGVDRSNGFEKLLFQRKNQMTRYQVEKNAWSREDM